MAPYKILRAWPHAPRLAVECAKSSKGFSHYGQADLANQLDRACYSVVLTIAEGSAGPREYRRFLDSANGSLAEVETFLGLARDLD